MSFITNSILSLGVKYGLGLKGVTKEDIKIIRKYLKILRQKRITEKQVFEEYYKAKADELSRLVGIIYVKGNKDKIVTHLNEMDIPVTSRDLNNILGSLKKIIKAKRENKRKSYMKKLILGIIAEYKESNPEWFDESPSTERTARPTGPIEPSGGPRRRRRGPRRRFKREEKLKF